MIRDFDHSLSDMSSEKNRAAVSSLAKLLAFFGAKDAQALDYWLDNSLFSNWQKPPKRFRLHGGPMREDVRYYKSMGFDRISSFACYLGEDYRMLYGLPQGLDMYAAALSGNETKTAL